MIRTNYDKRFERQIARTMRQSQARGVLLRCDVALGADFCALSGAQVLRLLDEANREKYRKPKNANGSRGRYYHERIQRQARDFAAEFIL